MKVFQIGFNKCGTSSIYYRLDALGFSATHLKTHDGRYIASIMQENLYHGQHILTGLEAYDAFTDIEDVREDAFVEGYKFYPQILRQVDDARFILNIRDRERWVRSRLEHNNGAYAAALLKLSGLPTLDALAESWRQDWNCHLEQVSATIPADRLLVHDIETDDPADIDRFLNRRLVRSVSKVPENFTRSKVSRLLSRLTPRIVKDALPKELSRSAHYLLRRRR